MAAENRVVEPQMVSGPIGVPAVPQRGRVFRFLNETRRYPLC